MPMRKNLGQNEPEPVWKFNLSQVVVVSQVVVDDCTANMP